MDNRNGEVDIFLCANMNSLIESDYFSPAKSTEEFNCVNKKLMVSSKRS